MYGSMVTSAELHRQDLIANAEHHRLVKEARSGKASPTFFRVISAAVASRFNDLSKPFQETAVPVRANHSQIEMDSGAFSIR